MISSNIDLQNTDDKSDKAGWSILVRLKKGDSRLFLSDEKLSKNGAILGRDSSCDIIIDDQSISKRHCRLQFYMGNLQITDVGSKNGVFIVGSGEQIKQGEYKTLTPKDRLRLGSNPGSAEIIMERVNMMDSNRTILIADPDDLADDLPLVTPQKPNNIIMDRPYTSNDVNYVSNDISREVISPPKRDTFFPKVNSRLIPSAKKFYSIRMLAIGLALAIGIGVWEHIAINSHEISTDEEAVDSPSEPNATQSHLLERIASTSSPVESATTLIPPPNETRSAAAGVESSVTQPTIREILPNKKNADTTHNGKKNQVKFGNFFALVIGNNDYQYLPKLDNAVLDAESVANTLANNYSFAVTIILNGTRISTLSTMDKIRSKLTEKDNLLIFFAGHGIYDRDSDRGYWLPVDAQSNLRANWISNADITDSLKAIQAKHILVVADSCYSGTLTRSVDAELLSPKVVERINNRRSRTVLASGGIEPVVDGGGNSQHSIFTSAFLDVLDKNEKVIDGVSLFNKIRDPVRLNAEQMPTYAEIRNANHEIGGDFLFIRH
ncbi:hypothetical protein CCP3SC5AM1_1250006 [Gammaproteobacteria bacterium]